VNQKQILWQINGVCKLQRSFMNMRNNGLNKSISKHVSRLVVVPLSIIGILAALSLLFLYGTIPMHNLNIRRMERALTAFVEENSDAIVLERMKFFGTRYSSSSECTYAVGAFMTTDMSPKDIIIAYENRYASFFGFGTLPIGIQIEDHTDTLPLDNPADDWTTVMSNRYGKSTANTTYYLLYLYSPGHTFLGDHRCFEWYTADYGDS